MKTTLRGVFLTSDQPEMLAAFYRDVASLPLETVGSADYTYWMLDREGMQLAIHDAEAFADYAHPPLAGSNLTHLYFQIADLAAFLDNLKSSRIATHAVDDVTATVIDPDGRKVLFGTA